MVFVPSGVVLRRTHDGRPRALQRLLDAGAAGKPRHAALRDGVGGRLRQQVVGQREVTYVDGQVDAHVHPHPDVHARQAEAVTRRLRLRRCRRPHQRQLVDAAEGVAAGRAVDGGACVGSRLRAVHGARRADRGPRLAGDGVADAKVAALHDGVGELLEHHALHHRVATDAVEQVAGLEHLAHEHALDAVLDLLGVARRLRRLLLGRRRLLQRRVVRQARRSRRRRQRRGRSVVLQAHLTGPPARHPGRRPSGWLAGSRPTRATSRRGASGRSPAHPGSSWPAARRRWCSRGS